MPHDLALEFERVTIEAGGLPYVHDVSLALETGRFHGLLGPNGAGKTTLLRTLYHAAFPKGGHIRLLGRDQSSWSRTAWSRTLGVLVQGGGLLAGLTVADIVDIGLRPLQLTDRDLKDRTDEALEIVGLSAARDQLAETLSGGELQRCYVAQLLARQPEVYVLDEPTNHLDLHYQYALLDEIKRRGKTVLATMHDLSIAARYCDHVSLMEDGRLIASGAPNAVLTPERLAQTYKIDGALIDGQLHVRGPLPSPRSGSALGADGV